MVIGGLKCPYFSSHSDCELNSRPHSREEELGCEEDDGVGDLLQVREGEDGRGLHQRMRYNAAAAVVLHVL